MNAENGNIYGPDDQVPEGVELVEIDKTFFDELTTERAKDVQEALRQQAQSQRNPGR